MDIMIPKKDGMSVLKTIRAEGIQVPVLFLTAKSETQDIVRGLDAGASDYMTKPFEFSELLARLRVMLRTVHISNDSILNYGSLQIDTNNHRVVRDGVTVDLTVRNMQSWNIWCVTGTLLSQESRSVQIYGALMMISIQM